ncbi:uncharacterized protein LOC120936351 [Rana temporaria]|uniref:uncharacterized protein LOC120936351 n=1 Tax=Rana temporaria TaxID=8407 RepID=UPI001AAD1F6A|nr:uncharacterized protein LOC120936351 [Rana temporaria]
MGSGSSKSKRRAIKICSNQLLEPPVAPIGSKKTVTCDQKKEDNNKETSAEGSNTTLTEKDRFISIDPDLKLIEDILTESEDCFFWPASSFARQMVTRSQNANTSHGSLFQIPQNQSADNKNLQIIKKTMSVCEESQNKYQTARDSCNTTAPVQQVLDIENNNLPKFSNTFLAPAETSTPITYNDVEEALMDSIEKDFSYIHSTSPLQCGET